MALMEPRYGLWITLVISTEWLFSLLLIFGPVCFNCVRQLLDTLYAKRAWTVFGHAILL